MQLLPMWCRFALQAVTFACARARPRVGSRIETSRAMIATTTSTSISVKARMGRAGSRSESRCVSGLFRLQSIATSSVLLPSWLMLEVIPRVRRARHDQIDHGVRALRRVRREVGGTVTIQMISRHVIPRPAQLLDPFRMSIRKDDVHAFGAVVV